MKQKSSNSQALYLSIVALLIFAGSISWLGLKSSIRLHKDVQPPIISYGIFVGGNQISSCTASRISHNKWITAKHCFPQTLDEKFLSYTINENAEIEDINFAPGNHDIAIFSIPSTKKGDIIEISNTLVKSGDILTLARP